MPSAREELIRLQKTWVADLKERIFRTNERRDPELDRYYDEYRSCFQTGFQRPATRKELVRQLERADIAYFGDFHTLKIAQRTVITLLKDVIEGYEHNVVLALEVVHTKHQRHVDDYLASSIDEDEFLDAIEYRRLWGFEWKHYRSLFEFARDKGLRVLALNMAPKDKRNRFAKRDNHAASLIAAASQLHPEALIAVVYGDLHIGETHIPAAVRRELAASEMSKRDLIIYQNSETYYWDLVDQERELLVDAVKVNQGVYCVMNATPLVKFQSWLNWQESGGELEISGISSMVYPAESGLDLGEQFYQVAEAIADFLQLEVEQLDDFELYTFGDLNFLDRLVAEGVYKPSEAAAMRDVLAARRSAYFPRARVVYLGSLSLNAAAEIAARFIYYNFVGDRHEYGHAKKNAFYVAVLIEAISVFGAMIMNPRYRVPTSEDHRIRLLELRGRRNLLERRRLEREVSTLFLEHHDMLSRVMENEWARNNLRRIYNLPAEAFRGVTRAIGALLGGQLFYLTAKGDIPIQTSQVLVKGMWNHNEAWNYYLNLCRACTQAGPGVRDMDVSL